MWKSQEQIDDEYFEEMQEKENTVILKRKELMDKWGVKTETFNKDWTKRNINGNGWERF